MTAHLQFHKLPQELFEIERGVAWDAGKCEFGDGVICELLIVVVVVFSVKGLSMTLMFFRFVRGVSIHGFESLR
jgi:hypothetical protein